MESRTLSNVRSERGLVRGEMRDAGNYGTSTVFVCRRTASEEMIATGHSVADGGHGLTFLLAPVTETMIMAA